MKLISHIKQLVTLAHLFFLPLALSAQNGITISNFAAVQGTESAPTTLTFNIKWSPPEDEDKVWSDTVWVFVDYNNKGTMTRLPLALNSGATLTEHSAAGQQGEDVVRLEEVPDNPHGVWVVGNARATQGAFTATVQLLLEETWRATSLHGLCIYAINYPPRAQYTDDGNIKLNGTPPFYLTFAEGAATVSESDAQGAYTYPPEGKQLVSLTDASLAPGSVPPCSEPAARTLQSSAQSYCAGSGVTFALSGTDAGAYYRLIDEELGSAASFIGTGSAATFSGTFTAGTYHVETAPGAFCPATLTSRVTVTEVALPVIASVSATTASPGAPATITALPSLDNATYTWTACSDPWTTTSNTMSVRPAARYNGRVAVSTMCHSTPATFTYNVFASSSVGQDGLVSGCAWSYFMYSEWTQDQAACRGICWFLGYAAYNANHDNVNTYCNCSP